MSFMGTRPVACLAAAGAALAITAGASAAAGNLDPSFGTGGHVTTDFSGSGSFDIGEAIAVQQDGRSVVAGYTDAKGTYDFALSRYNLDGSLDTTFGTGGLVETDLSGTGSADFADSLALQRDGKLVVVGTTYAHYGDFAGKAAIARYDVNGSLDPTFGNGGIVTTDFGSGGFAFGDGVAIEPGGKIVVAGNTMGANFTRDFAVARFKPDGSLDTSFGSNGVTTTDFGGNEVPTAIAVEPGGIVLAGQSSTISGLAFALARYKVNGKLDQTFGSGGMVTEPADVPSDTALGIEHGEIVMAGSSQTGTDEDFTLFRFTRHGQLDTSFGTGGKATTGFTSGSADRPTGLAIQPNGQIVVGGYTFTPSSTTPSRFALARFNADGTLDGTFGAGGKVTTAFGSDDANANALALQADGMIVAAGSAAAGGNVDIALARYQGS
jgi:uncharacterized delta-60 repeat protein